MDRVGAGGNRNPDAARANANTWPTFGFPDGAIFSGAVLTRPARGVEMARVN